VSPVVVNQQPTVAAIDAAFATSRPEVVTAPLAKQAVADTGIMHHRHHEDQAEAADAGLAALKQMLMSMNAGASTSLMMMRKNMADQIFSGMMGA
jgi:hypothetical protein